MTEPGETVVPKSMSVPLMVPVEEGAQKNYPGSLGSREKLGNGMGPGTAGAWSTVGGSDWRSQMGQIDEGLGGLLGHPSGHPCRGGQPYPNPGSSKWLL